MENKTLIFAVLFLSLALLLGGCFKEIPIEEVTMCEFDSDCIMVFDVGCCKCPTSINSDYQEYWDKLNKREMKKCDGIVCKPCAPSKAIDSKCVNTTCTILYSGVGI